MGYLLTPIILLTLLALIFGTFFIVKQQSAAVVERFGKFLSVRHSGLQIKIPLV
ncbi:SPFH domain-containing protein, partial [Flavobacteriales bacterium]|nr:SPFH domain-containing protein [Flavobacteriales bacterium]